jgi:hypothetical protein
MKLIARAPRSPAKENTAAYFMTTLWESAPPVLRGAIAFVATFKAAGWHPCQLGGKFTEGLPFIPYLSLICLFIQPGVLADAVHTYGLLQKHVIDVTKSHLSAAKVCLFSRRQWDGQSAVCTYESVLIADVHDSSPSQQQSAVSQCWPKPPACVRTQSADSQLRDHMLLSCECIKTICIMTNS